MKKNNVILASWVLLLYICCGLNVSIADEVSIAVASNALQAMTDIKKRFEKNTGNTVLISSGSTGKLYTQIINGAPFDIFLAANSREPLRLEQAKATVPGSRMTYAVGRLVLWGNEKGNHLTPEIYRLLSSPHLKRITLANPKTAPYGFAAEQYLQKANLWNAVQSKVILAENVTQAFQYTQSQNVQLGFVALSQIKGYKEKIKKTDYWLVPQKYYTPIKQQGVLLLHASTNTAARNFMKFLQSPEIKHLLQDRYGYGA